MAESSAAVRRPLPFVRTAGHVFAALDLGTNNCRLLVGTPSGSGFAVLERFNRMVCLGEDLERTGALGNAAMDRALEALADCAARLAVHKPDGLAAVATEACRRAANGAEFLARAHRETGLDISVISAREEVELAIESCAPLLARQEGAPAARRVLLFDIGGGSTELAWLRLDADGTASLIGCASLPVGVVTLAARYGAASFTPAGFAAMVRDVAELLPPFDAVHCIAREIREARPEGGVCLLGTSGTATTLAALALSLPRYDRRLIDGTVLTRAATGRALATLCSLERGAIETHPCIGPERLFYVRPGAAIFAALVQTWAAPYLIVADRGLREGMLLRLMRGARRTGRHHPGARGA
ncbi:MAG TPA: Ppx/GppA family phosphatase [Acetobacteraceae bacterium]|nr:Ppx/GppA family phosphatase [Acetobacteraceae bacterium]